MLDIPNVDNIVALQTKVQHRHGRHALPLTATWQRTQDADSMPHRLVQVRCIPKSGQSKRCPAHPWPCSARTLSGLPRSITAAPPELSTGQTTNLCKRRTRPERQGYPCSPQQLWMRTCCTAKSGQPRIERLICAQTLLLACSVSRVTNEQVN